MFIYNGVNSEYLKETGVRNTGKIHIINSES